VGVDDLVLGVELGQRHPGVARLRTLPADERVETALGIGPDALHGSGAIEQHGDE
jgi:hypothetical protein